MLRPSWTRWWLVSGLIFAVASCAYAQGRCKRITVEGEVVAGRGFEREIGGGLTIGLDPVESGWAVRVVPTRGVRGEHDYAELATPPYRSVNPLLVTTGFGFRAQDVVGWNPRRFQFAASPAEFAALLRFYEQ